MGQARQRKIALGDLYGTQAGSNRPSLHFSPLQCPAENLRNLGFGQVWSAAQATSCFELAEFVRMQRPGLLLQAGIVLLRGRSYLEGHDGRVAWDSPYPGHVWLVDRQGAITDPGLQEWIEFLRTTPVNALKALRPCPQLKARLLRSRADQSTEAEISRLVKELIDRDPQNSVTEGADLIYLPGVLDPRHLDTCPGGPGTWHLMARLTSKFGGFTADMAEAAVKGMSPEERSRRGIRLRPPGEAESLVVTVLDAPGMPGPRAVA